MSMSMHPHLGRSAVAHSRLANNSRLITQTARRHAYCELSFTSGAGKGAQKSAKNKRIVCIIGQKAAQLVSDHTSLIEIYIVRHSFNRVVSSQTERRRESFLLDPATHPKPTTIPMHAKSQRQRARYRSLVLVCFLIASYSGPPTSIDAAVTFFYPQLGNFTNVTLAVFHIANFAISREGVRVRIGTIGGRGGSYSYYKHSHIEFYGGNTGLPSASARQRLRINPSAVFGAYPTTARLRGGTSNGRASRI